MALHAAEQISWLDCMTWSEVVVFELRAWLCAAAFHMIQRAAEELNELQEKVERQA